jgi:hypothetical protein
VQAWQRVQINSFLPTLYIHVYILQCQNVKKNKHPNSIEKRRNKCSSNRFYVYPPSHPHTTVTVSYLCSTSIGYQDVVQIKVIFSYNVHILYTYTIIILVKIMLKTSLNIQVWKIVIFVFRYKNKIFKLLVSSTNGRKWTINWYPIYLDYEVGLQIRTETSLPALANTPFWWEI